MCFPYTDITALMESRTDTFTTDRGTLVTIHAPFGTVNDEAEQEHHDFIIDHWPNLAAASYMGFKRYGIGAVVVAEREKQSEAVDHPFGARKIMYSRDQGVWLNRQQGGDLPGDWLDHQFQTYDPNTTSIILFNEYGTMRAYAVKSTPTPPEAFQLLQAQQN